MKTAIVTGATGGIGREVVKQLLCKRYRVYGLSDEAVAIPGATCARVDVSSQRQVQQTVNLIAAREGGIDLFISVAGISIASAAERQNFKHARRVFDTNFWGAAYCAGAAADHMKKARRGSIVFVASMAGMIPIPYLSYYSASKAALISFAGALKNELRPFGVAVCSVAPGGVKTPFTTKRAVFREPNNPETNRRLAAAVASLAREERSGADPKATARAIVHAASSPNTVTRVAGAPYKAFALAARLLPAGVVSKLCYRRYR